MSHPKKEILRGVLSMNIKRGSPPQKTQNGRNPPKEEEHTTCHPIQKEKVRGIISKSTNKGVPNNTS